MESKSELEELSLVELIKALIRKIVHHENLPKITLLFISFFFLLKISIRRKSLKGKVIVLTGAGTGLGRCQAFALAREKAVLVVWDINMAALEKTVQDIKSEIPDAQIFPYQVDLSNKDAISTLAAMVKQKHGFVWGVINNAGIIGGQTLLEESDGRIEAIMKVNAMAYFWTSKAFLPEMIERNDGHIVGISSAAGIFPSARMVSYCASKHAARGFIEALRTELGALGKRGVKVTGVYPGHIDTELFKGYNMGMSMSPEYVANQIVDSIKLNRETVLLPWLPLAIGVMWQGILPVWLWDLFMLPTNSSLSNWKPDHANKLFNLMETKKE